MTTASTKTRLWRPRFSIRTLTIVVTLVCAYLGSWEATKRWGLPAVKEINDKHELGEGWSSTPFGLTSPMPFVVGLTQARGDDAIPKVDVIMYGSYRRHFFWCFGFVWEIPHGDWETDDAVLDHYKI